jgi:serine/threonine protein kinase
MSHSAAADIRIGTILRETYELTSLLGKGGMGSVFLARHLRLPGKQVAVKVLQHGDELSEEQYARFRREAEIASQLGHPNIVEVLDFHSLEDGTPYLVMEYLRGESLAHRLRKGRMSLREAFSIARQMGSALQAAHRAGVVHRDLKPANVFLVPTDSEGLVSERVKLLDFGISKLMGSQTLQTQEDVLMGTPRYMAPEQALGRNREIDARTDIFAFGCIVYEMLCGDSPFAGGTIAEVVYRVVHETPESLATRYPDLPASAVAAVERALAKNPKDRHPDVGTFILELTGTALQTLSGLGPDPTPFPPRGALRQSDPSFHDDESGSDATFVPSRLKGPPAPEATPAPPAQGPLSEQSIAFGSTLAAFRAAEQPPVQASPSVSASRPPTDLEAPAAVPAPTAQPPASPAAVPAPAAQPPAFPAPVAPPPPAPVPTAQPGARSKSIFVVAAIGAVVLLVIGIFVGGRVLTPAAPTPPTGNPPVAVVEPPPSSAPEMGAQPPPAPPPVIPDTPAVKPEAPPPSIPPSNTAAENKSSPRPPPRQGKSEAIPEEVRKELEEAERALASGDLDRAIRIAQRTHSTRETEASFFLIGRAYCQRRDLSNARAQWRNLSSQGKTRLREYCKQYEVHL